MSLVRHNSGVWIRAGRHSKHDSFVVGENLYDDQYEILKILLMPRTVIDVGAHIGTFAIAAAKIWRKAKIICIEADESAFDCLAANTKGLNAEVRQGAAVSKGETVRFKRDYPSYVSQISEEGEPVAAIPIGPIIAQSERPILLKLDCEGAEHDLLRIPEMKNVDCIVGEWHDEQKWGETKAAMEAAGMNVRPMTNHLFSAVWK